MSSRVGGVVRGGKNKIKKKHRKNKEKKTKKKKNRKTPDTIHNSRISDTRRQLRSDTHIILFRIRSFLVHVRAFYVRPYRQIESVRRWDGFNEQKRKFEMFKRQTIRDTDDNSNVLTHIDTTAVWTVSGFINAAPQLRTRKSDDHWFEQVCCRIVRLVVSHESFNRFSDFLGDTIELALGNRIATSKGDF